MDITLARTFLEVSASGSFISAAERLHLTQTAVSARIRTLEEQLGRRLFVRNKAGARLTTAGERFVRHATTLVQVWEQARQHVALPPGREEGVSLGGELSLWHPLLADWLIWMHRECPQIALRAEVDSPMRLLDRVHEGSLDIAVLYNPPQRPDLVSELLVEEKLVMVTSAPDGAMDPAQYVYVDWGPSFQANHQAAFPELGSPPVSISLGPLALTYLLSVGGSGYFRIGTAEPFLRDGRLRLVTGAPEFSWSAYVVYARRQEGNVIDRVRQGLRAVATVFDEPRADHEVGSRPTVRGSRRRADRGESVSQR
ncbi:LysR family transcriptional regulator [Paraburkholderia sp. BR14320]|uniref:LysR family transcriptional regulator n=1 Tax=unclassified Paraburkholderia TaxID=2615204 RepID=UPI0034CD50E6